MKTTRYIKLCALAGALAAAAAAPLAHAADLLVTSYSFDTVLRYDQETGGFIRVFAAGPVAPDPGEPCPDCFTGLAFRPDGHLYVAGEKTAQVLRYDGTSGAFLDVFVAPGSGGLVQPNHLAFGPDGNLYVSSASDQVLRYDGRSGAFLGVSAQGGGLADPVGLAFSPDGHLYVASGGSDAALRFDGSTGAFLDSFAADPALVAPAGLAFGPDGRLYVASGGNASVVRFDGASGAFVDVFVAPGSGGMNGAGGRDLVLVALKLTADPVERLAALIDAVNDYNAHHGISNSLDAKLDAAQKSLADLVQHNDAAARKALAAFLSEVESKRGQWLSQADADLFRAAAEAILDRLNGN